MLACAAIAVTITGCDDYDDRYVSEYASVVRIDNYGEQTLTMWSTDTEAPYEVKVLRSGHDTSAPTEATLKVMSAEEWETYANTYGLQRYKALTKDCYKFDAAPTADAVVLPFDGSQSMATTAMTLFPDKVNKFVDALPPVAVGGVEPVICVPMKLVSDGSSVLPAQQVLILVADLQHPRVELSTAGFERIVTTAAGAAIERTHTVALPGFNKWGFTVKVKADADALKAYNEEKGTFYTLMGSDALEVNTGDGWKPWEDLTLDFPVSISEVTFRTRITPSKVGMMDAMAIRLAEPSIAIKLPEGKSLAIVAMAVKPSNLKLKATATSSDDDGVNVAANLVDGKTVTFFQSNPEAHDGDPVYGSYVDFTLPKLVQYFSIDFVSRQPGGFSLGQVPYDVDLYVSVDGTTWTKRGTIVNMQNSVTSANMTVNYGNYDAGEPIKYIRWAVVKGGPDGKIDMRGKGVTASWSATSINVYGK